MGKEIKQFKVQVKAFEEQIEKMTGDIATAKKEYDSLRAEKSQLQSDLETKTQDCEKLK
jgi:peptidoglycan hydrolase CwlO-like protein